MSTTLETPSARWRESYETLVAEFVTGGEPLIPFPLRFPTANFPAFLDGLERAACGVDLPEGFVPHSTYWLVDEEEEVVAVSNLRHRLNDDLLLEGGHIGYGVRPSARRCGHATAVLAATLLQARSQGITRCLVTCDRANVGSAKAILRNGGQLESEVFSAKRGVFVQRYWIDLPRAD